MAQQDHPSSPDDVSIVKVDSLKEQDFGFYEGKPFYARQRESPNKTGREAHHEIHKNDPGFVDVESKDSLAKRSDDFIDSYLTPLFDGDESSTNHTVVVVSHGILLSHLWRRILFRLPRRSVTVSPEVSTARGPIVLEHLGGWSNTGFLELSFTPMTGAPSADNSTHGSTTGDATAVPQWHVATQPSTPPRAQSPLTAQTDQVGDVSLAESKLPLSLKTSSRRLDGYATTILAIDGKQHLQGFKRTRGGIGRAQFDEKQKTMDSFFKRAKRE